MRENYSVYIHENIANGKVYIGITCQKPENRWINAVVFHGIKGNAPAAQKSNLRREKIGVRK